MVETKVDNQKNNRRKKRDYTRWAWGLIVMVLVFWGVWALVVVGVRSRINESIAPTEVFAAGDRQYEVFVDSPSAPQAIVGVHASGQRLLASCTTCHATREPNVANNSGDDLDLFHQGLAFSHGPLACLSCHNPDDYDTLHLADGRALQFSQVMTLCGQCHESRLNDFMHGAHGGMNGYWDLTRGPKYRKNCIDCHDPHHPKMVPMQPMFKSKDRFLDQHDLTVHGGLHEGHTDGGNNHE